MKFVLVKVVDGEVATYEGKTVRTGDVVEFSDRFSEKALKNPDYKLVGETPESEPRVKRKYTRKPYNDGRGDT